MDASSQDAFTLAPKALKDQRTKKLLQRHRQHKEAYQVSFRGIDLTVFPDVFCPTYGEGGLLLAEFFSIKEGDAVLEIGTAVGGLAILAAQYTDRVVATDISPLAVACAQHNVEAHGLTEKVSVRLGNLFSCIEPTERFDLVLFNFPFMEGTPQDELEKALFDPEYVTVKQFFATVGTYLAPHGSILVAFSNVGDTEVLCKASAQAGFSQQLLAARQEKGLFFTVLKYQRKK